MRQLLRKRWLRVAVLVAIALVTWNRVRKWTMPKPPRPDAATFDQAKRVRILRDTWGVPHVFGESDADAAFGLAYAHAEDDWPTIQAVLAASRGRLGLLFLSKTAIVNDYYARLVRVDEEVDAVYPTLADDVRAVLEGYARGLNLYAYLHPDEADGRLGPYTGRDIAAGFAHKIPIMVDLPSTLAALDGKKLRVGDVVASRAIESRQFPGSNAHAVSRARSTDDIARLNVNSHQPWEGPVAWYEAHVHSEEGWNMTGGTFPGAPVILHGHNDRLGWAHTVNAPDLVDAYDLELNPGNANEYRFEGDWRALEETTARLEIDTGFFTLAIHKAVYKSVHGPVMKSDTGAHAVRWAGMGRAVRAAEQWFRMNKARDLGEWKRAMSVQAIPMFNTVYADRDHVFYVYNALVPQRTEGYDYTALLPGDRADAIWREYLPFAALPQVEDPPQGFVQSCNATPFAATAGDGNPDPSRWSPTAGIEHHQTNRSLRSLALFGGVDPISRQHFLATKWDQTYAKDAAIFREAIDPVLATFAPQTDDERAALKLLREWDQVASATSVGATLALLTWRPIAGPGAGAGPKETSDPRAAFASAVQLLMKHFGKVDVPLGALQRLHRGDVDLSLGGAPDVLNGLYTHWRGNRLVGFQGDSYVLVVEFVKDGVTSESIHQYGASCRPNSPHFADQAKLYARHELKPSLRTIAEIRAHLEREYHPGE